MDRDLHYPLQRIVGALFVVGGVWHAASPWIAGYSGDRAAVVSNIAAGAALVVVGVCYLIFRGARVLNWAAGAIGVWVMAAPALLDTPDWMALNEAYWGGPLTLVLAVLAAYDLRFHRPIDEAERAAAAREAARPADYATGTILTDRTVPGPAAARANDPRFRFVPTQLHAFIDYVWAAAVIAMPWVLGYDSMFAVAIAPLFAGMFVIFYSVFTQYEYGVWGVFTMRNHLWMDFAVGLFLALSPLLFGFAREVWIPHVVLGAVAMIAALVTSTAPRWSVAPVEWFPEPRDYPLASR
jgi:hypothetical protein